MYVVTVAISSPLGSTTELPTFSFGNGSFQSWAPVNVTRLRTLPSPSNRPREQSQPSRSLQLVNLSSKMRKIRQSIGRLNLSASSNRVQGYHLSVHKARWNFTTPRGTGREIPQLTHVTSQWRQTQRSKDGRIRTEQRQHCPNPFRIIILC
jgi:hypothetical protein